jgi:hypothetical protein
MKSQTLFLLVFFLVTFLPGCTEKPAAIIYIDSDADRTEELAAREIRKYIYQRTGELLPVGIWDNPDKISSDAILVGTSKRSMIRSSGFTVPELGHDAFILKTLNERGKRKLLVSGGSDIGTLYAAYHLAEQFGIGFYLDGDIIPDKKVRFVFPDLEIKKAPLFEKRGIQPFHDFPEGPDWWNKEDYKAVLSQLPKLKMNFFGLHTYPEGGVGPEPLTWIGLPQDVNADGSVKTSYRSRHFTTLNGTWGYTAKKTSEYSYGAGTIFSRDDFGADYMKNRSPWPSENDETGLFNDMGIFLNEVMSFAEDLGITTCLGTEIPLILPQKVIKQLKEDGINPDSPQAREKIYEGIFTRIKRTHPLDYYWFWTPENWTWSGNTKKDIDNTIRDFNAAIKALETVKPGFGLATCGWVLGPESNRSLFDNFLPKNIAFSCINQNLGWKTVDTAFLKINCREKWAIPWMEDDPGLTIPQLWAGRMRRDAADAFSFGCNGYFGIHWRTRELSMNVSALAKAAWDQPWNNEKAEKVTPEGLNEYLVKMEGADRKRRDIDCLDFYREWCRIQFGEDVPDRCAEIFTSLDGVKEKTINLQSGLSNLPRPADWINGPGGIAVRTKPWDNTESRFLFINELEKIRPQVRGKGNIGRFDFWLNQFKYLRSFEKLACLTGTFNEKVKNLKSNNDQEKRKFATDTLIPVIRKEAEELKNIHNYLLSSVSTLGGIGNLTNWQQHNIPGQIMPQVRTITQLMGDSLWAGEMFNVNSDTIHRLVVPSPQTMIGKGQDYTVKIICFNIHPETAEICWRLLGEKKFRKTDLKRLSDTWWIATLPGAAISDDFEYYITVKDGKEHLFPSSAPEVNQSVVIIRK